MTYEYNAIHLRYKLMTVLVHIYVKTETDHTLSLSTMVFLTSLYLLIFSALVKLRQELMTENLKKNTRLAPTVTTFMR